MNCLSQKTNGEKFINRCQTPMGKRLLQHDILNPINNPDILRKKYNMVDIIIRGNSGEDSIETIRKELSGIIDLEKTNRNIISLHATPSDIYNLEKAYGVILSVGGQTPNNLSLNLHQNNLNILGTHPENIDRAEDRHKFSKLLDTINVDQPEWKEMTSLSDAFDFCNKVDYPVLIRPSYVLSGAAMKVAINEKDLAE